MTPLRARDSLRAPERLLERTDLELTDVERARYEEEGFFARESVFDPVDLERLRAAASEEPPSLHIATAAAKDDGRPHFAWDTAVRVTDCDNLGHINNTVLSVRAAGTAAWRLAAPSCRRGPGRKS